MRGLLSRAIEARAADPTLPFGDSSIPSNGSLAVPAAGVAVNEKTALSIMTVYSCVALLADAVSTLPLPGYRKTGGRQFELDLQPQLLVKPWEEISKQDWLSQLMVSVGMRGNFFGMVAERDRKLLYPTQIQPLHPDQVTVRRSKETGRREYRVDGKLEPAEDVFHVPAITVPGGLVGIDPVEYARLGFGLAKATELYGAQFFQNSANASGVISAPGDLDDDETLALARSWSSAHQGLGKAHLPAVLTGGATWSQISITPENAQFLATREFQRTEIMGWFRIPPHMLGVVDRTTSWGTGIEQQEIGFSVNTLRPWLVRIESALSNVLPRGQYAEFNLEGRLRGDTLQRFQAYTLARNGSWMNVDEIRDKEGLPPLPDGQGQDHWAPLNFQPLDQFGHLDVGQPTKEPAAA